MIFKANFYDERFMVGIYSYTMTSQQFWFKSFLRAKRFQQKSVRHAHGKISLFLYFKIGYWLIAMVKRGQTFQKSLQQNRAHWKLGRDFWKKIKKSFFGGTSASTRTKFFFNFIPYHLHMDQEGCLWTQVSVTGNGNRKRGRTQIQSLNDAFIISSWYSW